ncbi:MAG: response regulator transcription factor [Acutalibacteraceae bacterium]|nr:response regulator transcription factor [Acutalibacteraceae bacterium]HCA53956.1 DNA-binding response regulator [Oscillospiraceae bacterium]
MNILIVEDETGLAEAIGAILRREGYQTDIANDGQMGLQLALIGNYDCILLDIMLPKMNGLDVLSYLRVKEIETPVLLLTARSETEDKIKGLDCGADDYLTKPFSMGELLARIRAMTRRKVITPDINPRYGDITLDIKKGEILCGAGSVVLGRKEFQMMEMLISNAGQIVTKEQFVTKIWGSNDESEYNNVEVYISFLRKKLSMLHSTVQIKTRRGIGYCLDGAK